MLSKEDLLVMSYSRSKAAGGKRGRTGDVGQKAEHYKWAGEGLTLGIPVIGVGDAAEPLLPGGIPDLGRDGPMVRRRQGAGTVLGRANPLWSECGRCAGRWAVSCCRCSGASEHPTVSWVGALFSSQAWSGYSPFPGPGVGGVLSPRAYEAWETGGGGELEQAEACLKARQSCLG